MCYIKQQAHECMTGDVILLHPTCTNYLTVLSVLNTTVTCKSAYSNEYTYINIYNTVYKYIRGNDEA